MDRGTLRADPPLVQLDPTEGPMTATPGNNAAATLAGHGSAGPDSALHAVLWDFDGTLADSEHLWMEAEYELIPSLGATWSDEHAKQMVGNALIDSAKYILAVIEREGRSNESVPREGTSNESVQREGTSNGSVPREGTSNGSVQRPDVSPEWIVDELTRRVVSRLESGPIPWRPGALELLASLKMAGIPCALVSASYRVMLDAVVRRLPVGTFDVVVAGDEVSQGKPHPEPYLTAAALLGVDPGRCIVLEDSNPGSASGNAAGALVLAVRNMVEITDAPRRLHRDTLEGLDAAALVALILDPADGLDHG